MSHEVDMEEVNELSDDFKLASEEVQTRIIKVKKQIEKFTDMQSFTGKAADSAKQYFNELHLTILESFEGLFDDLEENMKEHIKTFKINVDFKDSAIIKSSYLEEVNEDVDKLYKKLLSQDEIIHDTVKEVSDISSAEPPSFSDVDTWKKNAIEKLKELDGNLHSFTSDGSVGIVKEIMNQIETAMNNAKTNEGSARFFDFEGASKDDALAKLMDYNEYKEEGEEDISILMNKMKNGSDLSYTEREIIYQHIQDEILDEDTRSQIKETSDIIRDNNNEDNEKLKKYINDSVLKSEKALEDEIVLLEQYLFAGNELPSSLKEDTEERVALRSYLDLLKNHHTTINEVKDQMGWDIGKEDPLLARVNNVQFGVKGSSEYSGRGHMESEISIEFDQDIEQSNIYNSREDYVDFDYLNGIPGYTNYSEVDYYYGQDAVTDRIELEGENLEDEIDVMTGEHLGSELLGASLDLAAELGKKAVAVPAQAFLSVGPHLHEKRQKVDELQWKELKKPANKFKLEMQVNTRDGLEYSEDQHAKLYPTDETHVIIERWDAVHRKDPNFPYDAEAISNQNWEEMYALFNDGPDDEEPDLNEHNQELYNYVLDGTVPQPDEEDRNEIIDALEYEKK